MTDLPYGILRIAPRRSCEWMVTWSTEHRIEPSEDRLIGDGDVTPRMLAAQAVVGPPPGVRFRVEVYGDGNALIGVGMAMDGLLIEWADVAAEIAS